MPACNQVEGTAQTARRPGKEAALTNDHETQSLAKSILRTESDRMSSNYRPETAGMGAATGTAMHASQNMILMHQGRDGMQ